MINEAALASLIAALFSMMNPIGNVGVFASMTTDRSSTEATQTSESRGQVPMLVPDPLSESNITSFRQKE